MAKNWIMTKEDLRGKYIKAIPKMIVSDKQLSYADWLENLIVNNFAANILRHDGFDTEDKDCETKEVETLKVSCPYCKSTNVSSDKLSHYCLDCISIFSKYP